MWNINPVAGKMIQFSFGKPTLSDLYLFSYDALILYDGGSNTSPMMGKYCGNSIPPNHISSSNELLIIFDTDGSVTRTGFYLEYYAY